MEFTERDELLDSRRRDPYTYRRKLKLCGYFINLCRSWVFVLTTVCVISAICIYIGVTVSSPRTSKASNLQSSNVPYAGIPVPFGEVWAVNEFKEYEKRSQQLLSILDVGDEVWLKLDTQGYAHVLLYIGNGEVVHVSDVQKSGLRLGNTIIRRDKLDDVGKGHLIGYRKTPDLTNEMRDEIVQRALKDVGEYFPYNLSKENCEHQVKYWISGNKDYRWIVSTQVKDHVVIGLVSGTVGAAIGIGLIAAFTSAAAIPIILGAIGGGIITALTVVGAKYSITALEHRKFFSTSDSE